MHEFRTDQTVPVSPLFPWLPIMNTKQIDARTLRRFAQDCAAMTLMPPGTQHTFDATGRRPVLFHRVEFTTGAYYSISYDQGATWTAVGHIYNAVNAYADAQFGGLDVD